MTRLSFRPRPLDVNKKLAIVRSIKDLDGEDGVVSRSVHHSHIALDAENEQRPWAFPEEAQEQTLWLLGPLPGVLSKVLPTASKKGEAKEIPTPDCQTVRLYDKLYPRNFNQPETYVRRRPARAETEEFVEYDLDDEDEDWLESFNGHRNSLPAEKLELMLYHLELADARARVKATNAALAAAPDPGAVSIPPFVLGVKVPVVLQQAQAVEILRPHCARHAVIAAVFEFWKQKREKWGKPILRRLQPPPAVTDTNPFNVFRPREKAHRPNTRRMQRRENDSATFEKMQQVKKSLEDAQRLLSVLQRREEAKKDFMECEFQIQTKALQDPAVGKMYVEREAKRARQAQMGPSAWGSAGAPGGPRLKIVGPEDGSDYRGSGLNGFHTPMVATKRRSTAGGVTVSASAGAGGGSFLPPQGGGSRMRMPSPDGMEDGGLNGMAGSPGGVPDLHQLQMHRRKRRRHTMPLRGAAAASVAAAATARQTSKSVTGNSQTLQSLKLPVVKEPPRAPEPVMWFAEPISRELLKKHLHMTADSRDEAGGCRAGPHKGLGAHKGFNAHSGVDASAPASASARVAGDGSRSGKAEGTAGVNGVPPATSAAPGAGGLRQADELKDRAVPGAEATPSGGAPAAPEVPEVFPGLPLDAVSVRAFRGRPRFGRGGRLVFDRWDALGGHALGGDSFRLPSTAAVEVKARETRSQSQQGAKENPPSVLRFPVHRHRSQPRWRHTTARPPTPEDFAPLQSLREKDEDKEKEKEKENEGRDVKRVASAVAAPL